MISKFLKYIRYELNYSTYTVLSYSSDLEQFASYITNNQPNTFDARTITTSDIRTWLGDRAIKGDKPRTIRRKTQSVRAFFHYLLKQGEIEVNPTKNITLAKTESLLPEFVREEEIEKTLDNTEFNKEDFVEARNHLILTTLYSTGIRQAELIGIKDADINFYKNEIKITGKRNKQRIVPISDALAKEIRSYQILRDNEFSECPALFIHKGEPLTRSILYNIVNKGLDGTTSHKKSPHVLRHTFATVMLNNGANINSVKEFLGHSSLAATQIYTHISFNELKNSYEHAHPRALKKEV